MILQHKATLQSRSRHIYLAMFIAIAVVASVLSWTGGKASAANTLDQGTGSTAPTTIGGSKNIGQSFTAGKTGIMYELDLFGYQLLPPAGTTLIIEIHDGEDPNGPVLGTRTLTYNEVLALPSDSGGKFTVTFRNGINVIAGNKYTIMIHSSPNTGQVTMHLFDTDVYSGGMIYYYGGFNSFYDLAFQTYVSDTQRSYIPSFTMPAMTSTYGQSPPITATLMADGEPLANRNVLFSINEILVGSVYTNASGVASFYYTNLLSVGSHTVKVSFAENYPYYESSASTTLTVNKANLTVTANSPSKIYGAGLPAFTATYAGVVANDFPLITSATQFSTAATSASDVGSYPITPSLNTALNNYSISFVSGSLEVTPAPLSVTASNASRQYGAANPVLAGTLTGVVNSDNITASYTTAAVANSVVGNYAIIPQLVDPSGKLSNYAVTTTPAILSVIKAPLTVKADDLARWVKVTNPTLTGTITGALAADHLTAIYSTSADPISQVGTYPITITLDDPDNRIANYDVTTTPAVLTVYASPVPTFKVGDSAASVTGDVQLPAVDEKGNTLLWTSTDHSLLDPVTGAVHRPFFTTGDKQVTIQAAATVNHTNASVSFVLTLKAEAMTTPPAPNPSTPATPDPTVDVFNSSIVNETYLVKTIESKVAEAKEANATISFADTQGHWAEKTIDVFIKLQLINGYKDGTFKPNSPITRAEFAVILNRAFNIRGGSNTSVVLKDIDASWAKEAIENLVAVGVINGYADGTFKPNQTISREEMVVMLSRIVNLNNLVKDTTKGNFNDLNGAYAASEIKALAQAGVVSGIGDGRFNPKSNATRAEASQIILNVLKLDLQLKTLLDSVS